MTFVTLAIMLILPLSAVSSHISGQPSSFTRPLAQDSLDSTLFPRLLNLLSSPQSETTYLQTAGSVTVTPRRSLEDESAILNCSEYSDCLNCTSATSCVWSNGNCIPSSVSIGEKPWWTRASLCGSQFAACPSRSSYSMSDSHNHSLAFAIPARGSMYPRTFCSWTISNDEGSHFYVVVVRNSTFDKLDIVLNNEVVITDSSLRNPTNKASFSGEYKNITFYYMTNATGSDYAVHVMLVSDNPYGITIGYVPVLLVVLVASMLIYGVTTFIHCCAKQDHHLGDLVQAYERKEWLCSSKERLRLILENAAQGRYCPSTARFTQAACIICLAEFKDGCEVRTLNCGHIFHSVCIESWIESKIKEIPKCPVCNVVLPHSPALATQDYWDGFII